MSVVLILSWVEDGSLFCQRPPNGRPGGFASRESRSLEAAERIWKDLIEPVASEAAPDGCELLVLVPETQSYVTTRP
jgi:hypothetical protein